MRDQLVTGEEFRKLSQMADPDPRWQCRPMMSLQIYYERIVELALNPVVPPEIIVHFDTARNLLLYGWHVYRFVEVAKMQAFGSVEMALRVRLNEFPVLTRKRGKRQRGVGNTLCPMLERAIDLKLVVDDGFREIQRQDEMWRMDAELRAGATGEILPARPPRSQYYVNMLARNFPSLRNELAHGSKILAGGGGLVLEICCDLINQLFPVP
jgi:hypothetical protein